MKNTQIYSVVRFGSRLALGAAGKLQVWSRVGNGSVSDVHEGSWQGAFQNQGLGGSGVPPWLGVGGLLSGTCFTSCLAACLQDRSEVGHAGRTSGGGAAAKRCLRNPTILGFTAQ